MKLKTFIAMGILDMVGIGVMLFFMGRGIYYFVIGNDARCIEFLLFAWVATTISDTIQNAVGGYHGAVEKRGKSAPEKEKDFAERVAEVRKKNEGTFEGEDYGWYEWHNFKYEQPGICVSTRFRCPKYEVKLMSGAIVGPVVFTEIGFRDKEGKGFAGTVSYWRNARI